MGTTTMSVFRGDRESKLEIRKSKFALRNVTPFAQKESGARSQESESKLEIRNWKIETRNSKLETGKSESENRRVRRHRSDQPYNAAWLHPSRFLRTLCALRKLNTETTERLSGLCV